MLLETCHIPVLLRLLCITNREAFSVMAQRIQNGRFHFQAEIQGSREEGGERREGNDGQSREAKKDKVVLLCAFLYSTTLQAVDIINISVVFRQRCPLSWLGVLIVSVAARHWKRTVRREREANLKIWSPALLIGDNVTHHWFEFVQWLNYRCNLIAIEILFVKCVLFRGTRRVDLLELFIVCKPFETR